MTAFVTTPNFISPGHCDAALTVRLDMNEVAERNIIEFRARETVDSSLSFNQDLCFGCGLCASTCPTDAIMLADRQ